MNAPSLFCCPCLQRLPTLGAVLLALAPVTSAQVQLPGTDYIYPVHVLTPDHSPGTNLGKVRPTDPAAAITHKLQSIVIPHAEFRAASLQDAIEFLRQEGRRLDPEPDPAKRGVNIVVQFPTPAPRVSEPIIPGLPSEPTPPLDSTPQVLYNGQTPITLSMSRLPLLEALKYLAQQVGLQMKVEPDAVYMVPWDSPLLMESAEYRVQWVWHGSSPDLSVPPTEDDKSFGEIIRGHGYEKNWLESQGIQFPPHASAIYSPRTHKLLVRNTKENLDKIAALVSFALKPAAPTPAAP